MSFSDLELHAGILKAIEGEGYTKPTPIQEKVIPKILRGFDLRASAPTGTGKTAAFILPCLDRLMKPSTLKGRGPRVLVLVPTRELAMQVATQAKKYSKYLHKVKTVCVYGGAPYYVQNRELAAKYEILVATPGRLIDHLERGKINFSKLELLILDEADRMLDMGFIDPVEKITRATPSTRQTLMFSATLKGEVLKLSERLLNKPMEIQVSHNKEEYKNIKQHLYFVDNINHKHQLLDHFLKDPDLSQVLVFTSTKRQADILATKLKDDDHKAAALHGDMNQRQRERTLLRMRKNSIRILIATDVAARGIDVRTISHVINFDLPMTPEDYVHRIGRTARAGAKGTALSFASPRDAKMVKLIEQFTGQKIDYKTIPGMEPKKNFSKPDFSKSKRRNARSRNFKSQNSKSKNAKSNFPSSRGTKGKFHYKSKRGFKKNQRES
ncbi:MAG: ATP-dependent RNA helicase RhlE [Candidatus Anoxychlamydiales bacterium]|nr:ATP-dependent RNA helicase RhlE [Candidatus Anoxychlamydiales bacterium]NGX35470.1 ATP-dependent RNA helicase RhlE [Candidatus Anoxychlamydiales bacterium]